MNPLYNFCDLYHPHFTDAGIEDHRVYLNHPQLTEQQEAEAGLKMSQVKESSLIPVLLLFPLFHASPSLFSEINNNHPRGKKLTMTFNDYSTIVITALTPEKNKS